MLCECEELEDSVCEIFIFIFEFCWEKSKLCEGWLSKGDSDVHYMCNNGLSQGQHWCRTAWLLAEMKYEGTHGTSCITG